MRAAVLLLGKVLLCYAAFVIGVVELVGDELLVAVFGDAFEATEDAFLVLVAALACYASGSPLAKLSSHQIATPISSLAPLPRG